MIAAHVSRRYARALLELGQTEGNLEALVADVSKVAEVYEASHDLKIAIDNPIVPLPTKKAILVEICDKLSLAKTAKHVVLLLGDRRRLVLLPEIAQMLREMNDAQKGLLRAEVTTAVALSDAFYQKLLATLEKLSNKRVVLDKKHDPALIGGVVLRIGDLVLDSSLKTRLDGLKQALLPN
ncbi:MAG TPA: ATP synthase F1 subunit delta [Polyangiaceae bacterium]|jgi:F-type H+-transporting ATPase subunit delta|nr:ATP synthase F1 subunit delta [Polyangiaceae bacterium]